VNVFLVHAIMPGITEGVRRLIRAGYRDRIVLASEVGIPFAAAVRGALAPLLRSLGTDHLDVWLYGWLRARWHLRPRVWGAMQHLRADGRVRAIGFSSHDRALITRMVDVLDPDVLMVRYNAAHRGADPEVFARLDPDPARRPGVIAYTSTRWRMLLHAVPERGFTTPMTAPECYRFTLAHPAVDMAWCAAREWSELCEDVAGVQAGPLPSDRLAEVLRFGDAVHEAARGGRRWMFR
jgi:predicted aldo/keto reductase-like oxidoreductase